MRISDWSSDVCSSDLPRLREMPDILTDDIRPGRQYEVVAGTVVYDGSSYDIGDKFYGITSSGTEYSGGSVKQAGAFIKAKPGHLRSEERSVGKECVSPCTSRWSRDNEKQQKTK